jgi:hypothetical protein
MVIQPNLNTITDDNTIHFFHLTHETDVFESLFSKDHYRFLFVVRCCEEVGKFWGKSDFGDLKTARVLALTA